MILLYHRIAAPDLDPWELCVAPGHLSAHLEVLRRTTRPATLDMLLDGPRVQRQPAVAVTFDDGYADTLAITELAVTGDCLPVTVFVTTGGFDGDGLCWWDVLAELLLRPGRLPERLELTIGAQTALWRLGDDRDYRAADAERHRAWRAGDDPPTARHVAYFDIWLRLIGQPVAEQHRVLDQLRAWADTPGTPTGRLMTRAETAGLAAHPRVTIGAHTIHHPKLTALDPDTRDHEITVSRHQLRSVTGAPVDHFAYPYGGHDREVTMAVMDAGYASAVTTTPRLLGRRPDPYTLPRYQVPDIDGPSFARWLDGICRPGGRR